MYFSVLRFGFHFKILVNLYIIPKTVLLNNFLFYLFFGCAESSLRCRLFSSCDEGLLLFIVVRGLIAVASFVTEHGL